MANVNSTPSLVGFIHQYGENDFSIWGVELSEADRLTIEEILSKYESDGYSVRGDGNTCINEVIEEGEFVDDESESETTFSYAEAREDIVSYLGEQSEEYFTERKTTKTEVLADTELIAELTCEHLHCVKAFGNDRDWSAKDACDNEPGIYKS